MPRCISNFKTESSRSAFSWWSPRCSRLLPRSVLDSCRALTRPIDATRRWRMRRCGHAPGPDTGRALLRRTDAAAADRRCRSAAPRDPGRPGYDACLRGAARDDPGSLHGALRAARRISKRPDRDTRRDHLLHPADRRLRGRPGRRTERCARRAVHVAGWHRDGPRRRGGAGRGQGALRYEACRPHRRVHERASSPARRCRPP